MTLPSGEFNADFFSLFDLPKTQRLDVSLLERHFRDMQAKVHPDRHVQGSEAARRFAMMWATRVNEGYQTLKVPLKRAIYLLGLLGHDPQVEHNAVMPTDFLIGQMELREQVAEARAEGDEAALDALRRRLLKLMKSEYEALAELIDVRKEYATAAASVRQLMFQEKLLVEIDDALDAITV